MKAPDLEHRLFSLTDKGNLEQLALEVFRFQYEQVSVYRQFCKALGCQPKQVFSIKEIPFLPIQFFKSHKIMAEEGDAAEEIFTSSGTSGQTTSKHYVKSLRIYERSFFRAFQETYGSVKDYVILALLPSYLERKGSSLIYMAQTFIEQSRFPKSGFYLNDYKSLSKKLKQLDAEGKNILLIGVSFALLDMVEQERFKLKHTVVMETGGMKGRREEITREDLHHRLSIGFGVHQVHSEYGMCELLSQAYSRGEGIFHCPPGMDILIREPEDPLQLTSIGNTGGINIIDLANLYSCAFIATQDLGRKQADGGFQVLGRFDQSDIRGCNLMAL